MSVNETFVDVIVENGKWKFANDREAIKQIAALKDGRYTAHLTRISDRRSSAQNRLYFGVAVKALSDYTGYTKEEIHEFLKIKFLPETVFICDANGEVVDQKDIGGSTKFLSKIESSELFERIQMFAAEAGCDIPNPGELARRYG
jgi:hypothetical protein